MSELNRTAAAQSVSAFSPSQIGGGTRDGRARFEAIAAGLPGVVCELRARPEGAPSFTFLTGQIEELYGVEADELLADARAALLRIHPEDLPDFLTALSESARTLDPVCHEYRVCHPRRGELWIEMRATPVHEPDGTTRWYAFLSEVSARRRAEDAAHRADEVLRATLEATGLGTWVWDAERDHLELDDVALSLCGRTREEIQNAVSTQKLAGCVHSDDVPRLRHLFERAVAGDRMTRTEFRVQLRNGGTRTIGVRGSGIFDTSGRLQRISGVCKDVTSQRRRQQAEVQSQKLEALGTLAGGIAHEFNNLLFAVLGNARLIADELEGVHPAQEGLREIEHAVERATELVRSMQAFSRPRETRRELLQLRPMIDEVLKLMRVKLSPAIEVSLRVAPGVLPIAADPAQIQPLLVSLISNAIDAIGEARGSIEISVEQAEVNEAGSSADLPPGSYVVLAVRDTGCGMSPAILERIFDPFFTTKMPGQGTGLGLSVAHGVMRNHSGAITVWSEVGRGSVFRLYFPTSAVPELPLAELAPELAARPRTERILVVDDEPTLVRLVSRMLSRVGYRVTGYDDPQAALAAFRAAPHAYDAVITDLTMPALSGFELVSALRAVRADVPVLMTSGDLDDDARNRADLMGISELIPKPNTVGMLVAALDRALS